MVVPYLEMIIGQERAEYFYPNSGLAGSLTTLSPQVKKTLTPSGSTNVGAMHASPGPVKPGPYKKNLGSEIRPQVKYFLSYSTTSNTAPAPVPCTSGKYTWLAWAGITWNAPGWSTTRV